MPTKNSLAFVNKVNKKEAEEVFQILAYSIMFDSSVNTMADLQGKSVFISFFNRALEEIMQKDVVKSKQDRLKLIKFLDKLQQQKEALEFAQGNKKDLQIAAERLGQKSQSAFSSPNVRR